VIDASVPVIAGIAQVAPLSLLRPAQLVLEVFFMFTTAPWRAFVEICVAAKSVSTAVLSKTAGLPCPKVRAGLLRLVQLSAGKLVGAVLAPSLLVTQNVICSMTVAVMLIWFETERANPP
jgi:hypothetical protein